MMPKKKSDQSKRLEDAFEFMLSESGLPSPEKEYRFYPARRWRFDYAYPDLKIAIELEGGIYGGLIKCHNCGSIVKKRLADGRLIPMRQPGRHTTGVGAEADMEKYNTAAIEGWLLLRFNAKMIQLGTAVDYVKSAISYRKS